VKLRFSLAGRVTLIILLAVVAVWLGVIASFYWSNDWEGRNIHPPSEQIAAIVELVEQTPAEQRPTVLVALQSDILDVRVVSAGVGVAAPTQSPSVAEDVFESYAARLRPRPFTVTMGPDLEDVPRFVLMPRAVRRGLEFRIPLPAEEILIVNTRSLLTSGPLGLPVGFAAGMLGTLIALAALILMRRETRPIAWLARAVDRIDPGGSAITLPAGWNVSPAVQGLVGAFDRMQARLSQLMRARMAMLGGVSHDVRTFATRLRLRLDLIPEERERERAIDDIADMIRLLDDALLASRMGAGELGQELLEFDAIVISEVENRRSAGTPIDSRVDEGAVGAMVIGDRLALRRIVSNLADNALKYGRNAHASVGADGPNLVLLVDDDGPGIPIEMREIIFEPFVRGEASRSRDTGGAGLGLAVVRNLVEAHEGTIVIDETPEGGTRFKVSLPRFIPS
jgi:signal transduction histidine kinase